MGYSILSLILVIYAFTSPNTNYQIYIPPFFLFLLFISSKLEHWLQYQFDKKTQKSVFFFDRHDCGGSYSCGSTP